MNAERAEGIVLRHHPLTETSVIVHWLTRDQGRLATVARGARRPKSPFRGKLDVCFRAEFTFLRSRRSELHGLQEIQLIETFPGLRRDLDRLRAAAYATRWIELTTETESPVPELHDLLGGFLATLDRAGRSPGTVLGFELRLLEALGLQPDPSQTPLGGEAVALWKELAQAASGAAAGAATPPEAWRALDRFLGGFLRYHMDRVPRGRTEAVGLAKDHRDPAMGRSAAAVGSQKSIARPPAPPPE